MALAQPPDWLRSLHITDKQNSLLAALFFLGYFIFQVPGAAFARKHSPTQVVFVSLIIWGALASLTGIVHQFWLLAADRFLLGIAESIVFPAMLFLVTQWFTRSERSRANTALILGNPLTVLWMSAITGYLIKILGWQKTFIVEGIPAICWAMVWILIARDRPSKAGWITPEAAELLEKQLALEQLTIAPVENVRKALLRRDVLLLSFQYFCWSHWGIWVRALAAYDCPAGRRFVHPDDRPTLSDPLPCCSISDARCLPYFRQNSQTGGSSLAFSADGSCGFIGIILPSKQKFRFWLCLLGHCRSMYVCALWSILCDCARARTRQCNCRGACADQ